MSSPAGRAGIAGSEMVLRFLEARTSSVVFGLPGSSSVPIFHGIPWSRLKFVPNLQEGAAVAMADGYARFTGATGVLLYMLPGVATAMSNLYNAARDETPLVLVVSQLSSRSRLGQVNVGEADIVELVSPFATFVRELAHPHQLPDVLDAAWRAACGPPSGPAVVVIPEDHLLERLPHDYTFPTRHRERVAPADISPVVEALQNAEAPLIVVGGQVRRTGASDVVEQFAVEHEIPIVFEPFWNDRLGASPDHRCVLGHLTPASSLATDADWVLAIGCRMFNEIRPRTDPWFPASAFVAHVNADPRKVEEARNATWSCAADPHATASLLLQRCRERPASNQTLASRRARLERIAERRRHLRPGPYTEYAEALSTTLETGYLVDESVTGTQTIVAGLRGHRGDRYVSTTGASLGWSVGAACGVALATGESVTSVSGDGAFLFGVSGLWVASSERLPVTYVVLDNGGFGSTRWYEDMHAAAVADPDRQRSHYVGSDLGAGASVGDVAAGYGLPVVTVERGGQLADALESRRQDAIGPCVIHVKMPPED